MSSRKPPRRYPRMARVNEVVREAIGDELERLSDPRIGLVTVTGVDVTADLRQATVYYSALGRADERGTGVVPEIGPEQQVSTQAALEAAAPHLRASLGRQVRLKYTPELTFREDPSIVAGNRIEEIIRDLHRDDEPEDTSERTLVNEVDASLARAAEVVGAVDRRRGHRRPGLPRESRRRRARLDARPLPRAARRRPRRRGVRTRSRSRSRRTTASCPGSTCSRTRPSSRPSPT